MFCVLKINKRNGRIFEKIFDSILKDEYSVSTIPVFKGAPFYLLQITVGKRGVDWERVLMSVGKCASRLVVDNQVEIPENMNIGIYNSQSLYTEMMKNTFLKIIQNNTDRKTYFDISVLDKKAEYTDFIEKISLLSSSLSITTDKKEKYENVCEKITESTGLCPVMKKEFTDAQIKINTENNTMTVNYNGNIFNIHSGCDFTVPSMYEKLLPDGISKYDFYSALYELCGVFSLGEGFFDTILVNNEKKSVEDIHFS